MPCISKQLLQATNLSHKVDEAGDWKTGLRGELLLFTGSCKHRALKMTLDHAVCQATKDVHEMTVRCCFPDCSESAQWH